MKTSGKLPATGVISLNSTTAQWSLLEKRIIQQIPSIGIIDSNNQKIRINITLTKAFSPYSTSHTNTARFTSNFLNGNQNLGLSRIMKFQMDTLDKQMWVLADYIEGKNRIPIMIVHYEKFDITIYSQKLTTDSETSFFSNFSYN